MEVCLPQDQESQLTELAIRTGRGTDDLLQEAVARMLAHKVWFRQQDQVGIDQIDLGEFIKTVESSLKRKKWMPASRGCSNLDPHSLGSRGR